LAAVAGDRDHADRTRRPTLDEGLVLEDHEARQVLRRVGWPGEQRTGYDDAGDQECRSEHDDQALAAVHPWDRDDRRRPRPATLGRPIDDREDVGERALGGADESFVGKHGRDPALDGGGRVHARTSSIIGDRSSASSDARTASSA
jgi:hypothetical protein